MTKSGEAISVFQELSNNSEDEITIKGCYCGASFPYEDRIYQPQEERGMPGWCQQVCGGPGPGGRGN